MDWWDGLAETTTARVMQKELQDSTKHQEDFIKRCIANSRADLVATVVQLSVLNKQLSEIRLTLYFIALILVLAVGHFFWP